MTTFAILRLEMKRSNSLKSFHEVMCELNMFSNLTVGAFRKEFAYFINGIALFICYLMVFID